LTGVSEALQLTEGAVEGTVGGIEASLEQSERIAGAGEDVA
jgi:hypothetical protein